MKHIPQHKKKVANKEYEIWYVQGNQMAVAKCADVTFPSNNDLFLTMEHISFPVDCVELEAMYVPKNLLLCVREKNAVPTEKVTVVDFENRKKVEVTDVNG